MNPLVTDALNQTWGNPDPYNQVILRPARITPINGATKRLHYAWTQYALPNATSRFHVYQTGQISPGLINLFEAASGWQTLSSACNNTQVLAQVYTQLGLMLPITRCWYRWIDKTNIFLAVEVNEKIPAPWPKLEVFLRLYKNSFFESAYASGTDGLDVQGGIMATTADIVALQIKMNAIVNDASYSHGLIAYINGKRAPSLSVATVRVGDVAEYVYDSSVYKVVDFIIADLPTFHSRLDTKAKRLLHYNSAGETLIDYEDHIDFYIIHATSNAGVYMHKNAADTVRQLTHKDYAVAADYLTPYYSNFQNEAGGVDSSKMRLRMFVRYSGQGYMPKMDANMSKFLMDMNDLNQVQAMIGVDSNFALWQAASLEESAYMQLMRSSFNQFTPTLVEKAYGYYRVNSILGNNIFAMEDSDQLMLPPAFQHLATAFEYDADGHLLVTKAIEDQLIYFPSNDDCELVEFVEGKASKSVEEFYGSNPVSIEDGVSYRFYLRVNDIVSNTPVWQDVTGTEHYSVENGVAYWGANTITNSIERLVRSDKKFLSYEATLNLNNGVLNHQINYDKITTRGVINSPLQIPLGELDVWLNDKPLVRGVDYILDFPTISVINKERLVYAETGPSYQKLRVRMTGFCAPDLTINPLEEVGYIFNGVLSVNNRHDLHREKVQRIVVDGQLRTLDSVSFLEDGEDAMLIGSPIEGKPYEIRDVINRLSGMLANEPYALYRKTRQNAQLAESYASLRLPEQVAYPISPIANRYQLFSPFLSKILTELQADYIDLEEFEYPYSDVVVRSLCVPYLYLLPLDPIGAGNLPDLRYCVIHPHPFEMQVALPVLKYAFFERVVKIFANDKVVYSPLVHLA